jgi:hypothetical protein
MRGIVLRESQKLTRQRESGVIIVAHMLVIFCQVLEGGYTLTFGETLPDRHGWVPELTAFVQQGQIE